MCECFRSFKNMKKSPVEYGYQRKAWINVQLFKDWFLKIFIPEVKKCQALIGKTGKVLLLIDNSHAHP
uniref:DDE-1 domain-containing protein n=1 Tax=Trichuris muris TaxID=70415 RepID=A0A5S6QKJ3_TRIMR